MKLQTLIAKAEGGDAHAQNELGVAYEYGERGLQENKEEAFHWFMQAAKQGFTLAQYNVGIYYHSVQQNYEEAFKWYKKAARKGHNGAIYNLGVMYHEGLWMKKNSRVAFRYFLKAAQSGYVDAQNAVGFYYNGFGRVKRINYQKVVQWYIKSFETDGNHGTAQTIGIIYEKGGPKLKPDLKEAEKWYEIAKSEKALERVRAKINTVDNPSAGNRDAEYYEP